MDKIYFDNNSTTILSLAVRDAMIEVQNEPLNPSSIHCYGRKARAIIESARAKVASVLSVPKGFRITFTSSATEANNLIMKNAKLAGMIISIPKTEHPSILKGEIDNLISVNKNGEINLEDISHQGFYSIMLANNETGVIQSIDNVVKRVREVKSIIHIDAVQAIGKIPFSCSAISADAYTISGHKFGGPQGIGCLIYNPDVIPVKPIFFGGGQEQGVRPGTENVMAIHGLSFAIDLVQSRVALMQKNILPIRNFIENELRQHGILFGADAENRLPNTTSIAMPGVKSELQIAYFDSQGIAVSAGAACSAGRVDYPHVQMAMNATYEDANCAIRISLGVDNTMAEARFFINHWYKLYNQHKSNI
jgi:cysteine desulfurase